MDLRRRARLFPAMPRRIYCYPRWFVAYTLESSSGNQPKGMSLGESASYRSLIVASQYATWLFSQLLRLRYSIRAHYPPGLFERDPGHCLILAANHQTYVDLG